MLQGFAARVGIKPGFYHKAQPSGFYGFYEGGFLGFYVGFINLKVYHDSYKQLTLQFFCNNSAVLKRNSLIRIKAVYIFVCVF